ncbi:MAG: circularly permuted type 2 ATP-grasp protein [Ferruginibacter sp.]
MFSTLKDDVLFQQYLNSDYRYDALLDSDENLRPSWEAFFQSFNQLGYDEMNNRHTAIMRLLRENGVTYNIYGDPNGLNRPWELDMLPFLVSKQEWDLIETGLTQRAELFNLVLQDIYGEQRLIKEGILPMELVYRHSGFLRQCVGIDYKRNNSLVLYSADMARASDGKIWIVNDRTQAPSGSGYALENRTAMSRIVPELFNGLKVRQLQPYFTALRNALNDIAPHQNHNPRIVILTPGPNNETYFEHSYLASYLGFALVQGNDLIVKDNFVWLKTLEGLEKVDVILRRVDDMYCDPLELKEDSQLGVPGLLQVVRSGNVSIANPLGSSILENPGLMPFFENISQYFFGTGLIMSNIASWWCGQPKEMNYVLNNIESLVIKKIFRESGARTSIDAASLSTYELDELKFKIKANPQLYVGQEKVMIPSVPSLVEGKIVPRNSLFRSFLVSNGDTYTTMAGGLSRTSVDSSNFVISNQMGGFSKDTWVIAPEPERIVNVLRDIPEPEVSYANAVLPSHTAENLFWVGRYTERVLGNARFIRTVVQYINEGNRLMERNDIFTEQYLLKALTQYTYTNPGFPESRKKLENPLPELKDIVFNENRSGSLRYNYVLFNKAVFAVRDHWSMDVWRLLRGMDETWMHANDSRRKFCSIQSIE